MKFQAKTSFWRFCITLMYYLKFNLTSVCYHLRAGRLSWRGKYSKKCGILFWPEASSPKYDTIVSDITSHHICYLFDTSDFQFSSFTSPLLSSPITRNSSYIKLYLKNVTNQFLPHLLPIHNAWYILHLLSWYTSEVVWSLKKMGTASFLSRFSLSLKTSHLQNASANFTM
jgi:hypothetical protein